MRRRLGGRILDVGVSVEGLRELGVVYSNIRGKGMPSSYADGYPNVYYRLQRTLRGELVYHGNKSDKICPSEVL